MKDDLFDDIPEELVDEGEKIYQAFQEDKLTEVPLKGLGKTIKYINSKNEVVKYETDDGITFNVETVIQNQENSLRREPPLPEQSKVLSREDIDAILIQGYQDNPGEYTGLGTDFVKDSKRLAIIEQYRNGGFEAVPDDEVKATKFYRIERIAGAHDLSSAEKTVATAMSLPEYGGLAEMYSTKDLLYFSKNEAMALDHYDDGEWIALVEMDGDALVETDTPIFPDPESLDNAHAADEFGQNFVTRRGFLPTSAITRISVLRVE